MRVRFFWDFRGGDAQGTAEHFLHHLQEFLARHELSLNAGLMRVNEDHFAIFCDPPDVPQAMLETYDPPSGEAVADQVGRALRPGRVEMI